MAKTSKVELRSLIFFCEKLEKEVSVELSAVSFYAYDSECEMCGSHGEVSVRYMCECGKEHKVEINSW